MKLKVGEPRWIYVILLIGLFALIARFLLGSRFGNSALIYVAIPYLISIAIFQLTTRSSEKSLAARYAEHMRLATIIMLASSVILFEGFICVLFFAPIYYLIATITFLVRSWSERRKAARDSTLHAAVWPLIVGLLAIEGLAPSTSFERQNSVTRSVIIEADVTTLKANMAAPITLPERRHWFLSIFPLPVDVAAGSLAAGDIHTLDFVYKRWFFANVKTGEFHLRIDSVTDEKVTTSVVKNTSYLATYIDVQGTEVLFTPSGDGATEVTLTINYERKLDPAWYFGPLQKFATEKSADYLISSVIARSRADG